jgi:multidrug efflux pump subunit AcrA (membrane-fusion protein)
MAFEQPIRGTHVPVFLPRDGYGVVRAWFVKEGDKVTKGQKLAEVVPRERGEYDQQQEDDVVTSEHTGIVGMIDAKLGQFIEGYVGDMKSTISTSSTWW